MNMKQLLIGALMLTASVLSYGQDDIKVWKQKLKSLTPEQYKQLVEDNKKLQQQLSESRSETEHFRNESSSKDAEIAKLKLELEEAKKTPTASPVSATPKTASSKGAQTTTPGVVYKVQIGAFKNKNLSKYLDNHKNFSGDVDADGTRKYTLGEFTDYWEADRFKKYLREMGVKDAWIVSYKDGKRIPIKDALEGAF